MADGANISTSIELLGAKEYSAALRDINANLKLSQSSLKATQSAFRDMDGVDALRDKLSGLNAQYEQHRKKVELIGRQLSAAKGKYGENSQQVRALQTALNEATAAMNKCGHEIEETEDRLSGMEGGLEDAGKSAGDMGKSLDKSAKSTKDQAKAAEDSDHKLGDLAKAILKVVGAAAQMAGNIVVGGVKALGNGAVQATKALMECASGGAQYADDLLTLAVTSGLSTKTLQELSYASSFVDVSLDTMVGSMTKLTRTMGDMDKRGVSANDALTRMGLTIYDTNGQLKSSEDMFWETIYALGQVENQTERDALAMELFGKSAQELNPLIEAGAQRVRELSEEAHEMGTVMSDEALGALGSYQDSLDRMNAVWEGLKNNLGYAAAGLFQPFIDDATGAMAEVSKVFADGWQDTDAEKLTGIFKNAFSTIIADAKGLWKKLKPIIKSMLSALAEFVQNDLGPMLVEALEFLGDVVSELGDIIIEVLENIDWEKVGELISKVAVTFINVAAKIIAKLPDIIKAIDWAGVWDALKQGFKSAWDAIFQQFGSSWDEVSAGVQGVLDDIKGFFSDVGEFAAGVWAGIKEVWSDVKGLVSDAWGSFTSWLDEKTGIPTWAARKWDELKAKWQEVKPLISEKWSQFTSWLEEKQGDLGAWAEGVWQKMGQAWEDPKGFIVEEWANFKQWIEDKIGDISTWASGIWNKIKGAWEDVNSLVSDSWSEFTGEIEAKLGSVSGWASGLWNDIKDAWNDAGELVSDTWGSVTGWIDEKTGISDWSTETWEEIKTAWGDAETLVSESWESFTSWLDEKTGIPSWAEDQWAKIKAAWKPVKELVSESWTNFTGWLDEKTGIPSWAEDQWAKIKAAWEDPKGFVSDSWASFTSWIDTAMGDLGQWAEGAWSKIRAAWEDPEGLVSDSWEKVTGWIDEKLGDVGAWAEGVWNSVKDAWSDAGTLISDTWSDVVSGIDEKLGNVGAWAEGVWNSVKDAWSDAGTLVSDTWSSVTGWIEEKLGDVGAWAEGVWNGIKDAWSDAGTLISDTWSGVTGWIDEKLGDVGAWAEGVWDSVKDAWSDVKGLVSEGWASFTGWLDEKTGLASWAADRWEDIKTAWNDVKSLISEGWASFTGWLEEKTGLASWAADRWEDIKTAWNDVKGLVSEGWASFTGWLDGESGIVSWAKGVWSDVKQAWSGVEGLVAETWGKAKSAIQGVFEGLGAWFEDLWLGIVNSAIDAVNWLIEKYNGTVGKISKHIQIDLIPRKVTNADKAAFNQEVTEITESAQESANENPVQVPVEPVWWSGENPDYADEFDRQFAEWRTSFWNDLNNGKVDVSKGADQLAKEYMSSFAGGVYEGNESVENSIRSVVEGFIAQWQESQGEAETAGGEMADAAAEGIRAESGKAEDAAEELKTETVNELSDMPGKFGSYGAMSGSGFAGALRKAIPDAVMATILFANAIKQTMQDKLKIESPSKVFAWMGEMSAEGYADGIKRSLGGSVAAVDQMSGMLLQGAGGGAQGRQQDIDYQLIGAAVADAMAARGLGDAVITMDGEIVGRKVEPSVSRQSYRRATSTYKGRAAVMMV